MLLLTHRGKWTHGVLSSDEEVGIIAGACYVMKPERKNDYLGVLCFILGIAYFVIVRYITSLG